MVAYNGDGFRTGVDASRYFHVLRPGQFESGTQHVCLCPFNQTPPHGTCEDERGVEKMMDLQELPDHHGFEHGSESARGHDISVGREHEVVQPGEEGRVLERLLDERVHVLLERQVNPDSDASRPLGFLRSASAFVGGLHQTWATTRDDVTVHRA